MKSLIAAVAMGLLYACTHALVASDPPRRVGSVRPVVLDLPIMVMLDPDVCAYKDDAEAAADAWDRHYGKAVFIVFGCGELPKELTHVRVMNNPDEKELVWARAHVSDTIRYPRWERGGRISINPHAKMRPGRLAQTVLTHELGHILGLEHVASGIMRTQIKSSDPELPWPIHGPLKGGVL
jgi:hypothetical protein